MTPETFPNSSGAVPETFRPDKEGIGEDRSTTTTNRTQDAGGTAVVVEARAAMRDRGIVNPDELLSFAEPQAILAACRWFDSQRSAGPGVLAKVIRGGGMSEADGRRRSSLDDQREYGLQIVAWLRQHFPEFNTETGLSHPAAIAAVIRLHYRDGKGSLTKKKHGAEVRAAVKRWEARFSEEEG